MACVCDTLSFTFGVPQPQPRPSGPLEPEPEPELGNNEVALVVATPAWITGLS